MEELITSVGEMVFNIGMMMAVIGIAQLALFGIVLWQLVRMKKKLDAL
ncbi:hypothetical protein ES703_15032 [subsurface metagenome]